MTRRQLAHEFASIFGIATLMVPVLMLGFYLTLRPAHDAEPDRHLKGDRHKIEISFAADEDKEVARLVRAVHDDLDESPAPAPEIRPLPQEAEYIPPPGHKDPPAVHKPPPPKHHEHHRKHHGSHHHRRA